MAVTRMFAPPLKSPRNTNGTLTVTWSPEMLTEALDPSIAQ